MERINQIEPVFIQFCVKLCMFPYTVCPSTCPGAAGISTYFYSFFLCIHSKICGIAKCLDKRNNITFQHMLKQSSGVNICCRYQMCNTCGHDVTSQLDKEKILFNPTMLRSGTSLKNNASFNVCTKTNLVFSCKR